jgi:hypothetical protein
MTFKTFREEYIVDASTRLPDEDLLELLTSSRIAAEAVLKIYSNAIGRKLPNSARFLFSTREVRNRFEFMDDDLLGVIQTNSIFKLPLLWDGVESRSFDEILSHLFEVSNPRPFKKRVGEIVKRQGTRGLNNLFVLRHVCDLKTSLDHILNLNHSRTLPEKLWNVFQEEPWKLDWVHQTGWSERRILNLYFNGESELIDDIFRIMASISEATDSETATELKKKARVVNSFQKAHDVFLELLLQLDLKVKKDLPLHQEIDYLEGERCLEYSISVPRTGCDLLDTGMVLQHCVGSYIEHVRNGLCCILNLKLEGNIKYTLELEPSHLGYQIN